MKSFIILMLTSVLLITCGSDNADVIAGKYRSGGDPWKDVGNGALPTDGSFTDDVRVLDFGDGMRISYDATVPDDEEVCREEVVGNHRYGICMSLVEMDTPMEDNSLLWPLLILESFNGRIDCTIDGNYKDCDTEVFPYLGGGEDFCQSGVVNGDKALVCEDDWAVVANGEEGQSKTVCRVHLSNNSGRCLGAPKTRTVSDGGDGEVEEPVPTEELILEMQQSSWQGYHSENINPVQVLENDNLAAEVVTQLPTDAELSYKSLNESVCAVDNDGSDGTLGDVTILSGVAPDVCEVLLTISAPDFVDRVIVAEVAVVQANNTAWTGYAANPVFYVGEVRSPQAPTSAPASATLVYRSQNETICTVDGDSGEVTGVAGGDCVIVLNSSQDEYLEVEIESAALAVTPAQSFTSLAWAGFPTTGTVGTNINFSSNLPISQPAADTYEIAIASGDCTWDDSGKILSFQDATACTVRVTARKRGYEPQTLDRILTPAVGTFAIRWSPATAAAVGGELVLDAVVGAPGGAVITYAVKNAGTTGCTFKGTSGADVRTLLFTGVGTCTVTASARLTGYTPWTSSDVAINVLAGSLGNIVWGSFSGTLEVGGSRKAPLGATGTGLAGATVTYTLKDGSQANCDLINANTGEVEAKAVDLSSTKKCTIVGTATRTGYAPATQDISIDLSVGTLGAVTWGSFGGTLKVGGAVQTPSAVTGAGLTGGTVSYKLKSGSETNCELTSANTGAVQAKAVDLSSSQTCTVVGSVARTGYTTKTGEISINLSVGTIGDLTSPTYTGSLAVMGTLIVTTQPSGAPDGASWSYIVAGERSGGAQNGICTIESGTGAVSATASAVAGDFCIITARASALGYTAKDASVVRLQVSAQEALSIAWTGYSPSSLTWVSGGVTSPTLNTSAVTDTNDATINMGISRTYSVGDATTNNSCTVNSSTGALTINGAGICEIVLTVADNDGTNEESYATQIKKVRVTVAKGLQSITVPASPYGATPSLKVGGGDLMVANQPTGGQSSLALEYQSADTAVCTVGSGTGTVSPVATGTCTIQARRVGDNNFIPSDWEEIIELVVGQGIFAAITWSSFPGSATVGEPVDLSSNQPTSNPVAENYLITVESGSCAYDDTSDILSFTGTTECVVEVTASKAHYANKSATFRVTPEKGTLSFETTPTLTYSGDLRHGDATTQLSHAALPSEDDNDVSITWQYEVRGFQSNGNTPNSNVCTLVNAVNGNIRLLSTGVERDVCQVRVWAIADGYNNYNGVSNVRKIVQAGIIGGLTWNPQTTGTVGVALTLNAVGGTKVGDTTTYSAVRGSCSVVGRAITFTNTGNCVVKATVERNHYTTWDSGEKIIVVSEGMIAFATTPTLSYSGGLRYGDTTTKLAPSGLPGSDRNAVSITWNYTLQGRNSDDNGDKANVCTRANANSGNSDYNKIQLGTAALAGDICRVSVTGTATGYASYTAVTAVDLTVGLGTQTAPTGWSNHYGSSPRVRVGETLPIAGAEPGNSASNGGALEYGVKSSGTHCSVNSSSGEVRGSSVGSCVIQARFVAVANKYGNSPWADVATIAVEAGSQTYTWNQSNVSATFGSELALAELMGAPDGATIAYQIVDGANTAGCAWKGNSGTNLRTLTFADDGSCMVRVSVTRIGYNPWASSDVTITVTPASWTSGPAWMGYTGSATFNATPPTLIAPTSTPGATWTYATSTGAVCGVNENTGELSIGAAGDCIVTATPDRAGYGAHGGIEQTISIAKADQNAPSGWNNPYGNNPSLAVGAGSLSRSGSTPSGEGAVSYRVLSTHNTHCSVITATGEVTAKETGAGNSCTIQARFAGNANYNPSPYSNVATIGIESGTITLAWAGYASSNLTWSESLSAPDAQAVSVTPADANLTYTSRTTAVCTVASSTDLALTILKAGTCTVRVAASKTGYTSVNSDATVTIAKAANPGSVTTVDAYADAVAVGTPINPSGLPTNGEGGLKYRAWNQSSTTSGSDSTHCSVRGADGRVSANSNSVGQRCYIQARWKSNSNYNPSNWFNISGTNGIEVQAGSMALSWSGYTSPPSTWSESLGTLSAQAVSVTPSNADLTYSGRTTAVCTIASATDPTLTILKAGTCTVRVAASKTGYSSIHRDISLTINKAVNPGTDTAMDAYANSVAVGSPIAPTGLPSNGQGGLAYRVHDGSNPTTSSTSSVCIVEQSNGRVSGAASSTGETCYIHAQWRGNDNYRASGWFNISGSAGINVAMGSQSYSWGQAAVSATFGTELLLAAMTSAPASADTSYQIISTGNTASCAWKGNSGNALRTLTFANDGSCQVKARVTQTGYNPWTSPAVTITVNPASWTTAPAWTGYSATVTFNSPAPTITAPTSNPAATWTYDSTTSAVCEVNNSGVLTIVAAGSCSITAIPSLAGYGTRNHAGITQTFTIAKADQSAPTGWSNPYGTSPSTAVDGMSVSLDTGSTAPTGQGALEYQVKTGSTAYCTVGSDGTVAPVAAGDCIIQARFAGNANYEPSDYGDIATISVVSSIDQDPAITQQPVYSEGVNLYEGGGNTVTVVTPIVVTGRDGQVVANHYCGYTIANSSNRVCSIPFSDYRTGKVVVKNTARSGDTCTVNISCTGAGKPFPSTSFTLTVQPAITFAQLNTRILTPKCLNCHSNFHSSWTSNANLRNSPGRLNLDPTQANLWKRVQKAHDSGVTTSPVMPPSCTGDSCLSVVDVEYVASFLRGGTWRPEQSITAPTYTEGTNIFEGSGNQVWIVTAPEATESGTSTTIGSAIFSYSVTGKRGGVTRANICSINSTNGRVTVGDAAIDGDTCEITITSTATGYQTATTTHTLTVQAAITYTQIASRVITSRCLSCHSGWTNNAGLRNRGSNFLNLDPTQANFWKSVQKVHDSSITTQLMPQGCSGNGCLSVKDVEYVASFLRGGDWQSLMVVTPPVYSEGSNLYEGSGNQVWIATAPRATNREIGGAVSAAIFTYSAQGVRGGVITSNICSISSSDGRVTVGSAAIANDTCEITVKANAYGYGQDASIARVILTVQPAITYSDLKSRILTPKCISCHGYAGDFTTVEAMRNISGLLNTDHTQASLWDRVQRAPGAAGIMPTSCTQSNQSTCLSEKDVEYVASFLRGGDWQE